MTTFLLIRHAETAWIGHALAGHEPGVGLTARGETQAEDLVQMLQDTALDAIYSSPMQRATDTARPLSEARKLPVETREGLTEIRFGVWSGARMSDLEQDEHWHRFNRARSLTRAPQGELMLEVPARMAGELETLSRRHPSKTLALFTHADVVRATVLLCLGAPLDLFYRLEISPASVSCIKYEAGSPVVTAVNALGRIGF